jgi:hypothetical protein
MSYKALSLYVAQVVAAVNAAIPGSFAEVPEPLKRGKRCHATLFK